MAIIDISGNRPTAYLSEGAAQPLPDLSEIEIIPGETIVGRQKVRTELISPLGSEAITGNLVLVNGGWGAPRMFYADFAESLARRGTPAMIYDDNRTLGLRGDLDLRNLKRVGQLSREAGSAALTYAQEQFGFDEIDLYGHSRGGKTTLDVAEDHLEAVKKAVLDASCGFGGAGFLKLLFRTGEIGRKDLGDLVEELGILDNPEKIFNTSAHIFRNFLRTLAEGIDAGTANLEVPLTRAILNGLLVAGIIARRDRYFPGADVKRRSGHLFGKQLHERADPNADHFGPQRDPNGTADLVIYAFRMLEQSEVLTLDMAA
jgi:pimeloyl-ACP methyl ester carboxylesterase